MLDSEFSTGITGNGFALGPGITTGVVQVTAMVANAGTGPATLASSSYELGFMIESGSGPTPNLIAVESLRPKINHPDMADDSVTIVADTANY